VREKLMQTLLGIAQKDADRVVTSLVDLGALTANGDMGAVRRSIQYMLDNFMDKPFEEQSVASISDDLYEIAYDQPFRFPATFTFVMRAFSTLEGVGKGLDPEFNFMEVAQPFALQLVNDMTGNNGSNILDELGRQAAQVSSTALSLPRRIDDTIEKLERGDIRVRVSALLISATLLFVSGFGWLTLVPMAISLLPGIALLRLWRKIERQDRMM